MGYQDRDYYRPSGFGGFRFFPPVIKNLLIINGAIFFLMLLMQNINFNGIPAENIIIKWFALWPFGSGAFGIWQLISYQFLHGGFSHILFNMFALWMFGAEIENIWGSKKILIFYLLCGVGAGFIHMLLSPILTEGAAPTIGASGSVYGIMIAFAMMFPNRLIYLYFLIPVKAKFLIGFLIILELLLVDKAGSGVAHLAHLGGALVGFIFIMLDKNTDVPLKDMLNMSRKSKWQSSQKESNSIFNVFNKKEEKVSDANYYEIDNDKVDDDKITQDDIDKILDKISQSGYKNLTEREKKILFEASKRMK